MREALFSILAARGLISGARVLDLYAGTGALAIEALSRGAAHAVLVEADRSALAALRGNVDVLGLTDRARVLAQTVERAAGYTPLRTAAPRPGAGPSPLAEAAPFTLVLADPPYADVATAAGVLGHLALALEPGVRFVLEHAARDEPPEISDLPRLDTRVWGDTAVSFYGQGDL